MESSSARSSARFWTDGEVIYPSWTPLVGKSLTSVNGILKWCGTFNLTGTPPARAASRRSTFDLDANGILDASAWRI